MMTEKTKSIIDLRKQRKTYEEIMDILGVTYKSVQNVCTTYHVSYCDIEEAWRNDVEALRRDGKTYQEVADILRVDRDVVEVFCQRHSLKYSDLGQKQPTHSGSWNKGKTITDWSKRVFDLTGGRFELVSDELLDSGEHRLEVKCITCGTEKSISSISLRDHGKGEGRVKCAVCYSKACEKRREEKKYAERQRKEWERSRKRNSMLVQMEMNFCECGRLLPFGVKRCEACRKELARQRERRKEHKRRIREGVEFDKSISLEKLYERDHGICYICNKTCDWSDFQRINGAFIVGGSYPTVEHVKALCHGGTHTWDNVKLACHACNSKKGKK